MQKVGNSVGNSNKDFFYRQSCFQYFLDDIFRVALKTESELWRMIIEEMRIGRMLARGEVVKLVMNVTTLIIFMI